MAEALRLFQGWFADGTFQALEKTVLLKASWSDPDWLGGKVLFSETPVTQMSPADGLQASRSASPATPSSRARRLTGVEVGPNMMFCVNAKTKSMDAVVKLA